MASVDILPMYLLIMELRLDAMLYANLGNENSDARHTKCPVGPEVSTPGLLKVVRIFISLNENKGLEKFGKKSRIIFGCQLCLMFTKFSSFVVDQGSSNIFAYNYLCTKYCKMQNLIHAGVITKAK